MSVVGSLNPRTQIIIIYLSALGLSIYTMVSFNPAAVFLLAVSCHASQSLRSSPQRRLSFESIAFYEPKSLVTDHVSQSGGHHPFCISLLQCHSNIFILKHLQNAIDLDQAEMQTQLGLKTGESFERAKNIYSEGAFSKSVATVKISPALTAPLNKGETVLGKNEKGDDIKGKLFDDYPKESDIIRIQYETITIQESYVGCQVGANPDPITSRCTF
jgi:hypothetical protein